MTSGYWLIDSLRLEEPNKCILIWGDSGPCRPVSWPAASVKQRFSAWLCLRIIGQLVPQNHRAAPASLFRNILQPVSWCTWSQHYRRDGRWKLFTSVCYVDFSERILHRACFRKPQTLLHFLRSDQRLAHCIQPWTYIVLTSNDFFS